jgi:transcriptional regulator with XRE-family HTH domain
MPSNELLKLPERLAAAREAAGMSQRELARVLGVHPSQLCGLEKGRRRIAHAGFLEQFSRAVGLKNGSLADLRWALAHDQVVEQARVSGLSSAAIRRLSVSLQMERELDEDVLAAIEHKHVRTLQGKRLERSWLSGATSAKEGDAMT